MRSISQRSNTASLALAFIVLNLFDVSLTLLILQGGGYELNPVMRALLALGLPAAMLLKIGLCAFVAWVLHRFRLGGVLRLVTAMAAGVCLFNAAALSL